MSLSDLTQHIPDQTSAIYRFSFGTKPLPGYWRSFKESIWGKGLDSLQQQELVERDSDPLEDSHILPDPPPVTRPVATLPKTLPDVGGLDGQEKILVRSEYHETEKAALLSNESGYGVFVVNGQPGIGPPRSPSIVLSAQANITPGKSMFLLWLLMRRLALRLPTALQLNASYAILFHECGVSRFPLDSLDYDDYRGLKLPPGARPGRIWALIDSNLTLPKPADVFIHNSPFSVVNAASPTSDNLGWLEKTRYEKFYMNPWSVSEVIQA